jgi:hypothetical protein
MIAESRKKIENNRKVWDSENINKKQKKRTEKKSGEDLEWWIVELKGIENVCVLFVYAVCVFYFLCALIIMMMMIPFLL